MNNDIKEIIKFKDILNYYEAKQIKPTYCEELITTGELQRLLNYITNLQTIEQQYRAILSENAELENKITNLQEDIHEYEQLIDIQDKREYHKRYLEERRKEQPNLLYPDYDEIYKRYYEQKDKINAVIDDLKHFHLIYNEDGKLILSGESILAEIRYFIDKLEGTIPITMTPFEHDIWERENRVRGEVDEKDS